MSANIKRIYAREILDSRGNPTIETTVILSDNAKGTASIASGASVGLHEAHELRDQDPKRFLGKGVLKAVANVNEKIFPLIKSLDSDKQGLIDRLMIDLDGTKNKSTIGANAILSVSQALVEASAEHYKLPIYKYIKKLFGGKGKLKLPKPVFNLINAGRHGSSEIEFQEFEVIPKGQKTFLRSLQTGEEIYQNLKQILIKNKMNTGLGDEGGFSPPLLTNLDAFELLKKAVRKAGYKLGVNVCLGLDAAASEFFKKGKYKISDFGRLLNFKKLGEFYKILAKKYKFCYLEDPFAEDEWQDWQSFISQIAQDSPGQSGQSGMMVVGDDLLCTNPERLKKAIELKACNAVLIKPNQIGTISEVLNVVSIAQSAGFKIIVSHRSGETTDDFIADFAVGVSADYVKFGAPARGERVVKYNRLLEIEKNTFR